MKLTESDNIELIELLRELKPYVTYARDIANEMAERADRHMQRTDVPTDFVGPHRADALRHNEFLARIDDALKLDTLHKHNRTVIE